MGSWGEGPFNNDSAADMLAVLGRHIETAIKRKSNRAASYHYDNARAAIQILVISHGTDILGGLSLQPALEALERIKADEEWIDNWRNPRAIVKQLDKEIRQVKRAMAKCKGCSPRKFRGKKR
jgi:hypothetical protein